VADGDRVRGDSPLVPRRLDGAIDRTERWHMPGRFGDMSAGALTAILWKLDQGWLDDWADLCEYALCDDTLMSLYSSRATRVLQATWKVKPNGFGGTDAQLAAEFCNEQMGRLLNFNNALRYMMGATAVGLSASEKEWDSLQSPTGQMTYYLRQVHFRHPHRFRYDDQWRPRLWDFGKRIEPGQSWGKPLDPRKWIVYQHYEIPGYPNVSGFMRGAIWVWLFRRWADKFGIQALEKFGNPFLYAVVPPNTPNQTRLRIREDLQDLSNDHAGVVEQGIQIMDLAGMSSQSDSMHGAFMDRYEKRLARLILGASDAADPGQNGSNAAVATRTGSMTDPRMVTDGMGIGETWSSSVFRWMLEFNRHRFGGKMLPIPTFEAQTASDEVKTDLQDLSEQSGPSGGSGGGGPASGGGPGADIGAAISKSVGTQIAREESQNEARAIADDSSRGLSADTPDPKVLSRSSQGRRPDQRKTRTPLPETETSPTSTPYPSKLAETLRGASVVRRRS
jgi:phage gp29-like protein